MFKPDLDQSTSWEFIELLGEGSFGQVYKASRQLLGKVNYSAIKIVKIPQNESQIIAERASGATDDEIRDYFYGIVKEWQSEIEMLESLKSAPNVMVVEDYEIIEHPEKIQWDIYIRMELLTPFTKRVQSGSFYSSDALKLGIDLCRALEYCSARNILHRDIKPENIFVSSFGDYKLGDFGIARQLEKTNSSLSKKGTYMYMAPEVYRGEQYDASVDIYSLGLVLYKLFNNNRFPFAPMKKSILSFGEREESLGRRIRGDKLEPPLHASEEISNVILKACAFNPSERYKNPTEMIQDLQKISISPEMNKELISITKVESDMTVGIFNSRSNTQTTAKTEKTSETSQDLTQGIFQSMGKANESTAQKTQVQNIEPMEKLKETQYIKFEHEKIEKKLYPDTRGFEADHSKDTAFKYDIGALSPPPQSENKRSRKGVAWIAAFVVLLLTGAMVITQGFGLFSPTNQEVEIPNVVLINHQEAVNQLETLGLKVIIVEKEDTSHPVGTVLEQSIDAPNKVKKGSSIQLTVVKGIELITIPQVIGMDVGAAKTQLEGLGLVVSIKPIINDNKILGEVLSQSFAFEAKVDKGSTIELESVVHTEKITVPNLIGKTEIQAKDLLTSGKLNFKIIYVIDDNQTEGVVFNQSVPANSSVNMGEIIDISVYSKSPQISVPAFSGKTLTTYKTEAENLGFKVTSQESFSDKVASGQIISVSPGVGTKANQGSTIAVVVSKGKSIVTVKVPAGIGGTYATFQTNATNAGLIVSKTDKCSNAVANGSIISMSPSEGTTVNQGSTVNVVVSSGLCPWSEYVTSLPAGVSTTTHDVESKTQYQFRDKETTTSSSSTLAGWIKFNEVVTGYGTWGAWQTAVLTESSAINVESRTVYVFTRYRWKEPTGTINVKYSYQKYASFRVPDYYQEMRLVNLSLAKFNSTDDKGWHYFKIEFSNDLVINQWFGTSTSPYIGSFDRNLTYNSTNAESSTWYSQSKTGRAEVEYRSRAKIYTYHFYRWTNWSAWQDAVVTANTNKEVQTRTVYRYRSK